MARGNNLFRSTTPSFGVVDTSIVAGAAADVFASLGDLEAVLYKNKQTRQELKAQIDIAKKFQEAALGLVGETDVDVRNEKFENIKKEILETSNSYAIDEKTRQNIRAYYDFSMLKASKNQAIIGIKLQNDKIVADVIELISLSEEDSLKEPNDNTAKTVIETAIDKVVAGGARSFTWGAKQKLESNARMEGKRQAAIEEAVIELRVTDIVAARELAEGMTGIRGSRMRADLDREIESRAASLEVTGLIILAGKEPEKAKKLVNDPNFLEGYNVNPEYKANFIAQVNNAADMELENRDKADLIAFTRKNGMAKTLEKIKRGGWKHIKGVLRESEITRMVNIDDKDKSNKAKEALAKLVRLDGIQAGLDALNNKENPDFKGLEREQYLAGLTKARKVELRDEETSKVLTAIRDDPGSVSDMLKIAGNISEVDKVRFDAAAEAAIKGDLGEKAYEKLWDSFKNGGEKKYLKELLDGKYDDSLDSQKKIAIVTALEGRLAGKKADWVRSQAGIKNKFVADIKNETLSILFNGRAVNSGEKTAIIRARESGLFTVEYLDEREDIARIYENGFNVIQGFKGQTSREIGESLKGLKPGPGDYNFERQNVYRRAGIAAAREEEVRGQDPGLASDPNGNAILDEDGLREQKKLQEDLGIINPKFFSKARGGGMSNFYKSKATATEKKALLDSWALNHGEFAGPALFELIETHGLPKSALVIDVVGPVAAQDLVAIEERTTSQLRKDAVDEASDIKQDVLNSFNDGFGGTLHSRGPTQRAQFLEIVTRYAYHLSATDAPGNPHEVALNRIFNERYNYASGGTLRVPKNFDHRVIGAGLGFWLKHNVDKLRGEDNPILPGSFRLAMMDQGNWKTNGDETGAVLFIGPSIFLDGDGNRVEFSWAAAASIFDTFQHEALRRAEPSLGRIGRPGNVIFVPARE